VDHASTFKISPFSALKDSERSSEPHETNDVAYSKDQTSVAGEPVTKITVSNALFVFIAVSKESGFGVIYRFTK
jgi:hypothetical protein